MNILVISNNCFAQNNSNGRILGCLFNGLEDVNIRQFHIVSGANDFNICNDYYHIGDKDAIKSVFHFGRKIGKRIQMDTGVTSKITKSDFGNKVKKNAFTALIREIAWTLNKNVKPSIYSWIGTEVPDVVLLQAGDAGFMYKIAEDVSKHYNVPLVIFNTEFYYFEERNWLDDKSNSILFKIFKFRLRKTIEKVMSHAKMSIYNSDWLKSKYDDRFGKPSISIYQSSDAHLQPKLSDVPKRLVYVGNFSFNRHLPIIEISKQLSLVSSDYIIETYGPASEGVIDELKAYPNITYNGIIPYNEVLDIITNSKLLLLVESLDPLNSKLTEYGFSTKITDYMGTGVPILAYGSINNVGIGYLKKEQAAFVANSPEELMSTLSDALFDNDKRLRIVETALEVSMRNHTSKSNSEKFYQVLISVVKNKDHENFYSSKFH